MLLLIVIVGVVIVGGVFWYVTHVDTANKMNGEESNVETFMHINPHLFQEQSAGMTIIDVRTSEEFSMGHVSGALLADISAGDFKTHVTTLDRETPCYLYCRSGSRSRIALETMKDMGFKKVYGLEGGINAWTNAGFSLE